MRLLPPLLLPLLSVPTKRLWLLIWQAFDGCFWLDWWCGQCHLERVGARSAVLSAAVAAVSANQTSLASDVGRLSTVVSGLTGGAGSVTSNKLSQDLSVLSAAVAVVHANVTSLDSDVGRISLNVSAMSTKVDVISQQVSILSATGNILGGMQNNDTLDVSAGSPVYAFTSANTFKRSFTSVMPLGPAINFIGLVIDANIAVSTAGRVQTNGKVILTTAQWDSITGQSGGLTPGSGYYLSQTAGLLTKTPVNSGRFIVGVALTTTDFQLEPEWEQNVIIQTISANVTTETNDRISADNVLSNTLAPSVPRSLTSLRR